MSNKSTAAPSASRIGATTLWILVALGAAQLIWAAFLWQQLITHRSGGEAFCGFAALGDCASLWDSPFARGVRSFTGLPVATWGLVWGAAAVLLPTLVLWRRGAARSVEPFWSGTVLTGFAGAAAVLVLLAASAQFGSFCTNCVLTYALVAAYAGLAIWAALRSGRLELGRGALSALAPVAAAYLVLLYPASRTPTAAQDLEQLKAELDRSRSEAPAGTTPAPSPEPAPTSPSSGPTASTEPDVGSAEPSTSEIDAALTRLIRDLKPEAKQSLSDALEQFRRAPELPRRPARGLIGPPTARVQLTEFADLLCSHCASLHETLTILRAALPREAFSIEPRYFPLDGRCNPMLRPREGPDTSCVAAKVMICAAGTPRAFELSTRLFAQQQSLTPDLVYEIAAPFVQGKDLRTCAGSEETQKALQEDIEWAAEHGIRGTPLVLLDGRTVPANGQVLYALLLAGGDPNHPAFEQLPAPQSAEPAPS